MNALLSVASLFIQIDCASPGFEGGGKSATNLLVLRAGTCPVGEDSLCIDARGIFELKAELVARLRRVSVS